MNAFSFCTLRVSLLTLVDLYSRTLIFYLYHSCFSDPRTVWHCCKTDCDHSITEHSRFSSHFLVCSYLALYSFPRANIHWIPTFPIMNVICFRLYWPSASLLFTLFPGFLTISTIARFLFMKFVSEQTISQSSVNFSTCFKTVSCYRTLNAKALRL